MKKRLKDQILWQICQFLIRNRISIFTRKDLVKDLEMNYKSLVWSLNSMLKRNLISIHQNKPEGSRFRETIYAANLLEIEYFLRG